MIKNTQVFCGMIRNRSEENRRAIECFSITHEVMSPAFAVLRQELDSMIRVIYLLAVTDIKERKRLIDSTLQGENGKFKPTNRSGEMLQDREMVEWHKVYQGWTQSVYRFGCAFIHLSNFHNHLAQNPFAKLMESEKQDILSHMRYYHGGAAPIMILAWKNFLFTYHTCLIKLHQILNATWKTLRKTKCSIMMNKFTTHTLQSDYSSAVLDCYR